MAEDTQRSVTLKLEGSKATRGVPLATFETFIDQFLTALRYHYRATGAEPAKKTGRPYAKEELVTSFRLVGFRIGSGIAVLEPAAVDEEDNILGDVPTLALDNLTSLLDAVEARSELDTAVVRALDGARRALGDEGRFSVTVRDRAAPETTKQVFLDEALLEQLRPTDAGPEVRIQTISGNLHAIDLEPDKVGIRTPSGVDWSCKYSPELEPVVKSLIGSRVWVRGAGALTSARSGALTIDELHAIPEHEQTSLFTLETVSIQELLTRQAVAAAPQGLHALSDPEWEDGEESDRFLEAIFDSDGD
jgi:hypothetical protein